MAGVWSLTLVPTFRARSTARKEDTIKVSITLGDQEGSKTYELHRAIGHLTGVLVDAGETTNMDAALRRAQSENLLHHLVDVTNVSRCSFSNCANVTSNSFSNRAMLPVTAFQT
jgi:hypothetical protein